MFFLYECRCKLRVSEPLVSYRETIFTEPSVINDFINSLTPSADATIPAMPSSSLSSSASSDFMSNLTGPSPTSSGDSSSSSAGDSVNPKFDVHSLPPPWSDTPHLCDSFTGRYHMLTCSNHIAITFSSHAMSMPVLHLLESDPNAALAVSTALVHNGWRGGRFSAGGSGEGTDVSVNTFHQK